MLPRPRWIRTRRMARRTEKRSENKKGEEFFISAIICPRQEETASTQTVGMLCNVRIRLQPRPLFRSASCCTSCLRGRREVSGGGGARRGIRTGGVVALLALLPRIGHMAMRAAHDLFDEETLLVKLSVGGFARPPETCLVEFGTVCLVLPPMRHLALPATIPSRLASRAAHEFRLRIGWRFVAVAASRSKRVLQPCVCKGILQSGFQVGMALLLSTRGNHWIGQHEIHLRVHLQRNPHRGALAFPTRLTRSRPKSRNEVRQNHLHELPVPSKLLFPHK